VTQRVQVTSRNHGRTSQGSDQARQAEELGGAAKAVALVGVSDSNPI
jgi:hypothetical protein